MVLVMELRIDREIGAHRAGGGNQHAIADIVADSGNDREQSQRDKRDHQQADSGYRVQLFLFQHFPEVALRQIDPDRKHGKGRVQPGAEVKCFCDYGRQ